MRTLAGFLAAILVALAAPASAQQTIPFPYVQGPDFEGPNYIFREAEPEPPSEAREAEGRAAAAAEAACEAGDLAGCTALGDAYLAGAGRPKNRFVGELLLRQACDGADAVGCLKLGVWLAPQYYSDIEPAWQIDAREYGIAMLGRSCALGNFEACSEQANAVANGVGDTGGDLTAATALRREACARGSDRACRELAKTLSESDDEAAHEESLDLLARQCRKGDPLACEQIAPLAGQNVALLREMAELGCRADSARLCHEFGVILFAQESGPPEGRAAALALFDRACMLAGTFCVLPEQIRARPVLAEGCGLGEMADCRALAKIYGWGADSPLYSPAEAATLLGNACVAGMIETCSEAVNVLRSDDIPESPHSNASITLWHDMACGAGSQRDCISLGEHLLDSYSDADHRARGYAMLIQVCESGDLYTCGDLDKRTSEDPDAPLLAADSRFMPPLAAEEEAAIASQIERERAAGNRATVTCVSSRVTFRGVTYDDRQCIARKVKVLRGRLTREGEAPWQALIWRPEQMNGHRLTTGQRVECGGALIRAGWVLTAAHCVIDAKRRLTLTEGYEVRLGVLDASKPDGVSYGIRQVYAHPRYHAGSRTFDIALVELETRRQVRIGTPQTIKLILLEGTTINQRAPQAGAPVYVFGWGHTAFRGQSSAQLKVAEMALEDGAKCNGDNSLIGSFRGTILCAKAADRSQACDGDSGGPLVSYQGRPTVIGVVSAGTECGRTGKATRYTRVSAMRDWINKVLAGQEAPIAAR